MAVCDDTEQGSIPEDVKATANQHGQLLDGPKRHLAGQIIHKRTCGNKLLFLELQRHASIEDGSSGSYIVPWPDESGPEAEPHKGLEAVFSFEVYGREVRNVRKELSVGDVVQCEGTWRLCGRILDVFSYSVCASWEDIGGGIPFQVPGTGRERRARPDNPEGPPSSKVRRQQGKMCKFWMSNGSCMKANCGCEHPEGEALREARNAWNQTLIQKRVLSANPDDPHREEDKKCHAARAAVYAEWLCHVFGPVEKLRAGGGFLEVAGGRGELAFELSVKRGVPCTVLDPRCPGGGEPAAPWHDWHVSRPQRLWLKTKEGSRLRSYTACQEHVAAAPLLQCQSTVGEALAAAQQLHHEKDDPTGVEKTSANWARVFDCQVVVGLHPDQATGGVLELATALGKPFAVVPCCTFADDFPERVLDGRPVRTYDDLVDWLQVSGGSATKKDFLQFVGKNLVVYRPPEPEAEESLQ